MTDLIAYPFRLDDRGFVVVLPDDEDDYYMSEMTNLILTQPGERALVPDYGVEEATYAEDFPLNELLSKVDMFGPPVAVQEVIIDFPQDGIMEVSVEFDSTEAAVTDNEYDEDEEDLDDDDYAAEDLVDDIDSI